MLLSFWAGDTYKGDDDKGLSAYADDVCDIVGKPGIGEEVKEEHPEISGNSAYWWQVHFAAIDKYLHAADIKGNAVWVKNATYDTIVSLLDKGPVVCGTSKLGGLPAGHIILAVDKTPEGSIVFNDPYGDANTEYKNSNGAGVIYPKSLYEHNFSGNILYWEA
jgi:hypothetical protein